MNLTAAVGGRIEIYFNNMVIDNRLKLVVAILVATTTISSTCKKKFICADDNTYSFVNNVARVYPDKDSINIGDTLWIEISIPTVLKDGNTNSMIDFSNAVSVGNTFSMGLFTGGSTSDPGATGAVNKFNYSVMEGQQRSNSGILNEWIQFQFEKIKDSFYLKVAVIPTVPGNFFLGISDEAGVYRQGDPCSKAFFAFEFVNTDQHLFYYQNNRPGYLMSDYERQHLYCFKVN